MSEAEIAALAEALARAVREALGGLTIEVDGTSLGYAAANAINENRRADGKPDLEL